MVVVSFMVRRQCSACIAAEGNRWSPSVAAPVGGFVAFGYAEEGPDLDADGDVDNGLLDGLEDLFG